MIVTVAVLFVSVAPIGLLSTMLKVSLPSTSVSSTMVSVREKPMKPAGMVMVPVSAPSRKSSGLLAVPGTMV